jgi:hypothetical protein
VLKLYPQLGHYEPIVQNGKVVGTRLVSDPISIPDAAEILTSVNKQLNDRLGPQAARRVRTDMLATDPAYAALDALATSLRNGIDEGLTSQGVPGVKAFRQDQAAVIKLQQIAEKVEGKGTTLVRSTAAPPGPLKQAAKDALETTAAKYLGGKVVSKQLNRRLTIDEAVAKAFRLMKPAPNLSFPMMPAHVPGAGPAQAAGAAPGGAGPTGQPGGPQAAPGATSAGAGPSGPSAGGARPGGSQPPPRRPGETWEQWGRRNGVPNSWWNQGGKPGEPWGPKPQTGPWGTTSGVGELPPAPAATPAAAPVDVYEGTAMREGLPKPPTFVVDAKGKVRRGDRVGPQIPADAQWPRPLPPEAAASKWVTDAGVPAKDDPSFVRAVKGVYAKVFKSADAAAPSANQPLSTPAPTGAQPRVGTEPGAPRNNPPRVHFREAREAAARLRDETLDTLTQRYVEAGHPDSPAQIRAKLVEDLQGIEQLHHDAAAGDEAGTGLLKAIAKYGGISVNAESAQKGEITWLKEFKDGDAVNGVRGVFRDLSRNSADVKRMNMQRAAMGKDARAVPFGGLSLDGMLEALKQDGKFQQIKTINDLTEAVQKAARTGAESAAERKARALADLVYHTERDIAGRGNPGPDDDAGFAAFSDAVDAIVNEKPKGKR